MANRLAQANSAYLKSAAHQPIDWYPFGPEAFEAANRESKPILLDIGAVWCHWCHVIDRESYENDDIAQLINQYFIPVKVDRDERPDVDARYQQVVASMTGQGGWPLTAFLAPDGRVIYGGTYYPPETMKTLLNRIHQLWEERKGEILSEPFEVPAPTPIGDDGISAAFVERILANARSSYDGEHGGFGTQPKFPHFSTLELLMTHTFHHPDDTDLQMIRNTLTHMAQGGVYDQLAGGFHRYSVDRVWHVPHFEKMAYDNAEALVAFTWGARLTGDPAFANTAKDILAWVTRDLSDAGQGGFYASQDADISLDDDGDHFTWTVSEVQAALTSQEAALFTRYYDMTEQGDMHERPGRNVLWCPAPLSHVAEQLGMGLEEANRLLASAREKLMLVRGQRVIPFIDQTLYVNWNGMMIRGFLEAGTLLEDAEAITLGLKSLDRMLNTFYTPGQRLLHTHGVDGMLEDYAYLGFAALLGYQVSGQARYLDAALGLADLIISLFEDTEQGGFYDTQTTESLALLKLRRRPLEDSPSSSANALAIRLMLRLHWLTQQPVYGNAAERALKVAVNTVGNYGIFVSAVGTAVWEFLNPPLKLDVAGHGPMAAAASQVFFPGKVLAYHPEGPINEIRPCVGTRCLPPVQDPADLPRVVRELAHTSVY
jgi:uncharacterized protein YyaL (SSP411 family)